MFGDLQSKDWLSFFVGATGLVLAVYNLVRAHLKDRRERSLADERRKDELASAVEKKRQDALAALQEHEAVLNRSAQGLYTLKKDLALEGMLSLAPGIDKQIEDGAAYGEKIRAANNYLLNEIPDDPGKQRELMRLFDGLLRTYGGKSSILAEIEHREYELQLRILFELEKARKAKNLPQPDSV